MMILAQVLAGGSLIQIVVTLIVLGVLLWVVESLIPMDPTIKRVIHVVVVLIAVLWILGLLTGRVGF